MKLTCKECLKVASASQGKTTLENTFVCNTCIKKHYSVCSCCKGVGLQHMYETYDNKLVCCKCKKEYKRCCHCGKFVKSDKAVGYNKICPTCFSKHYFKCAECGGVFPNAERSNLNNCYECWHETKFHYDSYTPRPLYFYSTRCRKSTCNTKKELFLGAELEIDEGDFERAVEELRGVSKEEHLFYLKGDGSLSPRGIEIVTHPCLIGFHTKTFPWAKICDVARKHDYKSYDTSRRHKCGLHVHVSRGFLTKTEQMKLALFVHSHKTQIEKFAQRPGNIYCLFADPKDIEEFGLNDHEREKYEAVNYCNQNTIEFRSFSGTLKHETILASLQFCDTVCKWVKTIQHDFSTKPEAWKDFADFALAHRKKNSYLADYLEAKALT